MTGTRRRRSLMILVGSGLFAAGIALTLVSPLAAHRTSGGISVFVSCVMKQRNHTFDVTFGYENTTGAAQTIPLGAANHLTGAAPNGRKPPESFAQGKDSSALFVSNLPNGATLGWVVTFGGVTSTATASAGGTRCGSSSSPSSTTTTTAGPPPAPPGPVDVGIVKTVAPGSVHSGQTVVYTLRVTNDGPRAAVGVRTIDRLPAGLVLVHASIPHGTCTQSRLVVCRIAVLGVGQSVSERIVARVDADHSLVNSAVVTAVQPETRTANNTSRVLLHVSAPKHQVAPATKAVHATPHFTG